MRDKRAGRTRGTRKGGQCPEFLAWSVVPFSVSSSESAFKKLEAALSHPETAALVDKVITDDISFVLFKLRFWQSRFFATKGPRTVYFGNVATNHFSIGFDDIFHYYTAAGSSLYNLTNIQMRSVLELSLLLHNKDVQKFHNVKLNFHITDIGGVTLDDVDPKTADLRAFFVKVSDLHILSVHNLGFLFLRQLRHCFGSRLFPHLETFSINHIHGQTTGMDRFNFNSLYDLSMEMELSTHELVQCIDIAQLRNLELNIGCNHIYCPRSNNVLPLLDEVDEEEYCGCLPRFFTKLGTILCEFESLESISISKMGHLVVTNPYSMFHFKRTLCHFLGEVRRLKRITLDTNAAMYPYHDMVADQQFREMVRVFIRQNAQLYRALVCACDTPEFVDYFESVHIWYMSSATTDACGCKSCAETKQKMYDFVDLNRQIQFYLNPTVVRSTSEYLYDLIATVCDIMRRPYHYRNGDPSQTGMSPGGFSSKAKVAAARQITSPEPAMFAVMRLVADPVKMSKVSLHALFNHNNYKLLICPAHNVAERSRCWAPELTCGCDGTELGKFAKYIQHQAAEERKAIS